MKKEEKTGLTKERILLAAMEEFGEKGYAAASLNNICAAGIPKGLLYHNYENKDALYLALSLIHIFMLILQIGRIMYADFGLFFQLTRDQGALYSTTDVLDTYIYRALRVTGDIGIGSAVGCFQAVTGFILIVTANFAVRKIDSDSALF